MVDIPMVQSIGSDVCILFCILSISIVLYCGLLAGELAQLCYIVHGWYPYCSIHWNWCSYLVLHTFHIHCPLLWITSLWVGSVMLYCVWLISLLSNPLMFVSCFAYFHVYCRLLWITSRWVGSVMLYCAWLISLLFYPLFDVCILFCILSISIVRSCGLLEGELAQLCCIVHGWYPYCPIHWNWCLYLVLHTFHIHCPLLWITSRWVASVMLYCAWLISLLSNPLELMFVSCFAYFPYPLSFPVNY